ncbi:hypothetical protein RYZ26_18010 [Terasakiella sp. A23]|uniref:hypothetical protein n=1 Tax=Terasakiella sp. FCG-A23 TaxID=3080561 RepID=UPI002953E915|nr:hypothetical protein [Terasakiella sp. A23]MDV7341510.1 hypothetical protein [Terasakiella sp. A23]
MMDHKAKFESLADEGGALLSLFLFGWVDNKGNGGDYGLNVGPAENTFTTLINTTYMFQPFPNFILQCRPFEMNKAQFDYLQDNDLDTEEFLMTLGDLPDVAYQIDLSKHKDAACALSMLKQLL